MIHVCLDTSPLQDTKNNKNDRSSQPYKPSHSVRGIGTYTRNLLTALQQRSDIVIQESPDEKTELIHYPFFDLFKHSLPIRKKTPTVVTIHDTIPLLYPEKYPVGWRGWAHHQAQKWALRSVAHVITDSQASAQDIQTYLSVPAQKISVVPLAASSLLSFQSESFQKKVRQEWGIPKQYILYVGDISYNKNLPQLIKTLKYLPEKIHLVCVGRAWRPHPIPEWQAIQQQITVSDVANRVIMLNEIGADKNQELSALYSGALCYVQPSLAEGFGLPVLEALSCKTVVVSSNTTSLPEVGGTAVFYAAPEAESLAKAVEKVLALSDSERAFQIEKGSAWASHFTWQRTAEQTLKVYKKVLDKS